MNVIEQADACILKHPRAARYTYRNSSGDEERSLDATEAAQIILDTILNDLRNGYLGVVMPDDGSEAPIHIAVRIGGNVANPFVDNFSEEV